MIKTAFYIVNGITFYRLVAAPLLIVMILFHHIEIFRWLLAVSFFTDAIDGYLARRYKVVSKTGSKLDSIADDLTILAAIAGIVVFEPAFVRHELPLIILLGSLYLAQLLAAIIRYGKITAFHTLAAKTAAILQGIFLLLLFFLERPVYPLFYAAAVITIIDLIEEFILVLVLPKYTEDVKGLWWVIKRRN